MHSYEEMDEYNDTTPEPNSGLFKLGEEIEIKGRLFVVHALKKKRLILKLAPLHR